MEDLCYCWNGFKGIMSCQPCDLAKNSIKEKLGRCQRCLWQLVILQLILWPMLLTKFYDTPRSIEAIIIYFALAASAILLLLHLLAFVWRRWIKVG
ncbi:MAG: DUF3624 family protein [Vibrionaceae bacterium]